MSFDKHRVTGVQTSFALSKKPWLELSAYPCLPDRQQQQQPQQTCEEKVVFVSENVWQRELIKRQKKQRTKEKRYAQRQNKKHNNNNITPTSTATKIDDKDEARRRG